MTYTKCALWNCAIVQVHVVLLLFLLLPFVFFFWLCFFHFVSLRLGAGPRCLWHFVSTKVETTKKEKDLWFCHCYATATASKTWSNEKKILEYSLCALCTYIGSRASHTMSVRVHSVGECVSDYVVNKNCILHAGFRYVPSWHPRLLCHYIDGVYTHFAVHGHIAIAFPHYFHPIVCTIFHSPTGA